MCEISKGKVGEVMYAPGTIINASDRKYIVAPNGSWRVYEYKENSSAFKQINRRKNETNS